MQYSTVKWFDAKKGYGFINHPDEGEDVFVHYSQIVSDDDFKTLRTGQRVKFEMDNGPKGLHALDVTPVGEESASRPSPEAPDAPSPGGSPSGRGPSDPADGPFSV
jgi:CspA family cold shock protein